MWLEHLLLHSMLQHESGTWTWGRYVVVHPAGNADVADAVARYRDFLADDVDVRHHDRRGAARDPRPSRGDDEGAARALSVRSPERAAVTSWRVGPGMIALGTSWIVVGWSNSGKRASLPPS